MDHIWSEMRGALDWTTVAAGVWYEPLVFEEHKLFPQDMQPRPCWVPRDEREEVLNVTRRGIIDPLLEGRERAMFQQPVTIGGQDTARALWGVRNSPSKVAAILFLAWSETISQTSIDAAKIDQASLARFATAAWEHLSREERPHWAGQSKRMLPGEVRVYDEVTCKARDLSDPRYILKQAVFDIERSMREYPLLCFLPDPEIDWDRYKQITTAAQKQHEDAAQARDDRMRRDLSTLRTKMLLAWDAVLTARKLRAEAYHCEGYIEGRTLAQACAELGCSANKVGRWARDGYTFAEMQLIAKKPKTGTCDAYLVSRGVYPEIPADRNQRGYWEP